jgi:hypothetical protein
MPYTATPRPPCRLFPIFARQAPRAVIFRRGPTDWVRLILWHTDTDQLEYGQWFKGRIYERRCDLSPDGSLLVYFARKISGRTIRDKRYTYAWTAISRPPFLTALALWPKGDCWAGGGLFGNDTSLVLNHGPTQAEPHPNHLPPTSMIVRSNPSARGEDGPIFFARLIRDGWQVMQTWPGIKVHWAPTISDMPRLTARKHPTLPFQVQFAWSIDGYLLTQETAVTDSQGWPVVDTGHADWLDWDQRGRLVVLRDGKVLVGEPANNTFALRELVDLNPQEPEAMLAPNWATHW